MLNPFALFIYLLPVMGDLSDKDFRRVLLKSSIISLIIFVLFLFSGNLLFEHVLQISFESFRIFGGIVIFSLAYIFIVKGQKAMIHMKGSLEDLASEIALPFMVGAGTISLTILMGYSLSPAIGIFSLILIVATNYVVILLLKYFRDHITKQKLKVAFDKNMEIFLRLSGFFVGAIGIDMIIKGLRSITG